MCARAYFLKVCFFISVLACSAACSAQQSVGNGDDVSPTAPSAASPESAAAESGSPATGSRCTGVCALTRAEATFGGASGGFDDARFGLVAPVRNESGVWELWVELYAGSDGACPTEDSPLPERAVLLRGIPVSSVPGTLVSSPPAEAVLVDFEGSLSAQALLRAKSTSVTVGPSQACDSCASADMFVSLDFAATFADGALEGHAYARHCPAMDEK